jgi:hypothetical protein
MIFKQNKNKFNRNYHINFILDSNGFIFGFQGFSRNLTDYFFKILIKFFFMGLKL